MFLVLSHSDSLSSLYLQFFYLLANRWICVHYLTITSDFTFQNQNTNKKDKPRYALVLTLYIRMNRPFSIILLLRFATVCPSFSITTQKYHLLRAWNKSHAILYDGSLAKLQQAKPFSQTSITTIARVGLQEFQCFSNTALLGEMQSTYSVPALVFVLVKVLLYRSGC